LATPVIRLVDRMEFPSTRALTTATCLEKGSLFMSSIMLERSGIVKVFLGFLQKKCAILSRVLFLIQGRCRTPSWSKRGDT
jgi:hypothetical protein